jgi:hypothetical protein
VIANRFVSLFARVGIAATDAFPSLSPLESSRPLAAMPTAAFHARTVLFSLPSATSRLLRVCQNATPAGGAAAKLHSIVTKLAGRPIVSIRTVPHRLRQLTTFCTLASGPWV